MIQPAPLCHKGNMAQAPYVQRMMRLLPLLLLAVSLLLASSCRKDDEGPQPPPAVQESEDGPCVEAPQLGLPPLVYLDTAYVEKAIASPLEADVIIIQRNQHIIKINLLTKERKVVLSQFGSFSFNDWGTNDWILFHSNQGLMKVKSNGDSLTFITGLGGYHPAWHPDGSRYMYTELNGGITRSIVRDRHDQILDTLPRGLNVSKAWVSNNMLWWTRGYYLIDTDSLVIFDDFGGGAIAAIDESMAYANSQVNGMFIMRLESGQTEQIVGPYSVCERIQSISYSPLKNMLLGTRLHKELLPDGRSEFITNEIVWLNMDGSIHEVIDHRPFLENL